MTRTALAITSAERFWLLGLVGIYLPVVAIWPKCPKTFMISMAVPQSRTASISTLQRPPARGRMRTSGLGMNCSTGIGYLMLSGKHMGIDGRRAAASRPPNFKLRHYPAARILPEFGTIVT
jgi:hypothetical protein